MGISNSTESVQAIVAPADRPDWFVVPKAAALQLRDVPGCVLDKRGRFTAHRSLLPLVGLVPPVEDSYLGGHFRDGTELRPHQVEGVRFATTRRGSILAHEPRVGKTAQATAAHNPRLGPLVVVAPLQVREVWINWLRRRWPTEEISILTGTDWDANRAANHQALIFVHYDVLPAWQSIAFTGIGTLVLDEAHVLSKRNALRTQAASVMAAGAARVIALTGTPLWNAPKDLFPILHLICPGGFGSYSEFTARYCDGKPGSHGWTADGLTNTEELQLRLAEVMLRRTWADVADVPPIAREQVAVPLDTEDYAEIAIASEEARRAERTTLVGKLARVRRALGKAKIEAAFEQIGLHTDEPIVVWVWHRKVALALRDLCIEQERGVWIVTGEDDVAERDRELAGWKASAAGVLVISMSVGQVGIDLSHAAVAVFAELDFTPAVVSQAEMRIFSPARPSKVVFLVAEHEVETLLVATLEEKLNWADATGVPAAVSGFGLSRTELRADMDRLIDAVLRRG